MKSTPALREIDLYRQYLKYVLRDLAAKKASGQKWAMLTCYEQMMAAIFDEVNIPVLLVGDSAGNNFLGYENTIPVTVDELIPLARAVVSATNKAMVVADLPFGSYENSPEQALVTGVRFFKEAKVHAVKLEGGKKVVPQIEKLIAAGIPVMGHLGLTPQSVHTLGGFKVQGRGEDGERIKSDAKALAAAGVFAIVLEAVPANLAKEITQELSIPIIGIGAGIFYAALPIRRYKSDTSPASFEPMPLNGYRCRRAQAPA